MIEAIIAKQIYLLGLISAFVIGGILRKEGYFASMYDTVSGWFSNKKVVLGIMSAVGGIMPVEGRCSVSAPILDSIVKKNPESRSKLGIVDYISTHHYYLWSPIEPSVMIIMAALGISWLTFMAATMVPLAIYVTFLISMLVFYIKSEDIDFHHHKPEQRSTVSGWIPASLILATFGLMIYDPKLFAFWHTFPVLTVIFMLMSKTKIKEALSYVNWKTIGVVAAIIALGVWTRSFNKDFLEVIETSSYTVPTLMGVGALFAFIMGSSSKYAGLGAAMLTITSPIYLPIVVVSEYVGYLLSPIHKCLFISKSYFNTDIIQMYKFLIPLAILLMSGAGFYYVTFVM